MDLNLFLRKSDTSAEKTPETTRNVARAETVAESDDGQQFTVIVLDADDSFDVVVQYPDNVREIVWSLARERYGADK